MDLWFPFYPGAWLTSETVRLLSNRERGIYLTLLLHQFQEGSLPSGIADLAALVGEPPAAFEAIWKRRLHLAFRPLKGARGRIVNPKMDHERHDAMARIERLTEQRRNAGKSSARQRAVQRSLNARSTKSQHIYNNIGAISETSGHQGEESLSVTFCARSRADLTAAIRSDVPPGYPDDLPTRWPRDPDDLDPIREIAKRCVAEFSNVVDSEKARRHIVEFIHALVGVRERGFTPIHAWGAFHNLRRALDAPIFGARAKDALRYLPARRAIR